MPRGTAMLNLPFGPWTSILSVATAIFTPEGSRIGLFPMRDIVLVQPFVNSCAAPCKTFEQTLATRLPLPDFAQQFASDIRFARGAATRQSLRRGDDADTQSADHRLYVMRADIAARSGTRDALDAGDDAAAVRSVFQENAQRFVTLVFVDHFEGRNVALFLKDAGNFALQTRRRHIDAL